jgi:predicted phage-related endonuclease
MSAPQRTEQWHADRAGKITASMMGPVMDLAKPGNFKTGPRKGQPYPEPESRREYIRQLAAERITGRLKPNVKAAALEWGKDVEPVARAAYEARTGLLVTQVGFMLHPDLPYIGASPDFLVLKIGGGEVKCPESIIVHLQTLEEGLPPEHIEQIQCGLCVTGRQWWDFVSFHPHYPAPHDLFVQRIERDEKFIAAMLEACASLEAEVCRIVAKYRGEA